MASTKDEQRRRQIDEDNRQANQIAFANTWQPGDPTNLENIYCSPLPSGTLKADISSFHGTTSSTNDNPWAGEFDEVKPKQFNDDSELGLRQKIAIAVAHADVDEVMSLIAELTPPQEEK